MRVLITSSRMPFALDEIRKFGRLGHDVYAADTFATAPGSHSRFVTERFVTPSPKVHPRAYLETLLTIVHDKAIDLYLPAFEEVFYVAKHRDRFGARTRVFAPGFEPLARLHDKSRFVALAHDLGVPIPETVLATDPADLAAADRFGRYIARPAFSRGGVGVISNPASSSQPLTLAQARPSPEDPWLVQRFIDGLDVCTFSVARSGRIVAHASYVHPRTIEGGGGIVFESVDDPVTLEYAQRFVEATGYDGQISFDFIRTKAGKLWAIECNPRPTAGVCMMSKEMLVGAILGPPRRTPRVTPPGIRRHFASALVRGMFVQPRHLLEDLRELLSPTLDVYAEPGDRWPALYQWLSYLHVLQFKRSARTHPTVRRPSKSALLEGYFHDVSWNGEAIP